FQWHRDADPTEEDMRQVFAAAGEAKPSIASRVASGVKSAFSAVGNLLATPTNDAARLRAAEAEANAPAIAAEKQLRMMREASPRRPLLTPGAAASKVTGIPRVDPAAHSRRAEQILVGAADIGASLLESVGWDEIIGMVTGKPAYIRRGERFLQAQEDL